MLGYYPVLLLALEEGLRRLLPWKANLQSITQNKKKKKIPEKGGSALDLLQLLLSVMPITFYSYSTGLTDYIE